EKEVGGEFLDFQLHLMLHWDPQVHHAQPGQQWEQNLRRNWSLSGRQAIERALDEHKKLVTEFDSIAAGIETTLGGTAMQFRRLRDEELFCLIKRSLNPLSSNSASYRGTSPTGSYESIRSRISNVSIEGESDDYLKI